MQLQFQKSQQTCLKPLISQVQNTEQVQELRLPDGMPDIGRVLCAWGQVLLRGKEWGSSTVGASGGVMTWALYEPEEGEEPQVVEAWLPFQLKWDIPQTRHEGKLRCKSLLRGVDARSTSTRKLMLRANVSMLTEAYEPEDFDYFTSEDVPADVQLLKKTYPVCLAMEAGEKMVELDEELALPASAPKMERLIRLSMQPELIDRRVMADKVVFRGSALTHILYRGEDGQLHTWDFETPFSQYAELDAEYGPEAEATVIPELTNLELDVQDDGRMQLKGSMTCQYMIYDRHMLELVEDAYSPHRQVNPEMEIVTVPSVLELGSQTVTGESTTDTEMKQPVDTAFYPKFPDYHPDSGSITMQGRFQTLGYDDDGKLEMVSSKWEQTLPMDAHPSSHVQILPSHSGLPQAMLMGQELTSRSDLLLDTITTANENIPMIFALELGEIREPDPNRPSLILRRPGEETLWEIAKKTGSTPDKIRKANHLEDEPTGNEYLLIPVL